MSLMVKPVLVINAAYEPVAITPARDAVKKLVKRVATIEEEWRAGQEVYPGIPMPSVIRLLRYRRVPVHMAVFSRKNILLRDRYRCQYCGERFPPSELTLDHVISKSRGGPNAWENIVACCRGCNHRKGNKSPAEAGMTLLHKPKTLTIHTSRHLMRRLGLDEDERWGKYLYA